VQLIVDRITNANGLEVDVLEVTERGEKGFGSSDLIPKRSILPKEEGTSISFLNAESDNNEFFSVRDIGYNPQLRQQKEMLSSPHVNKSLIRTMNDTFLDNISGAGNEDEKW